MHPYTPTHTRMHACHSCTLPRRHLHCSLLPAFDWHLYMKCHSDWKYAAKLALTIQWLRGDLPYCNLVIRHEGSNSECQEMWGRISASFLYVAQGDSSYLMYKSVLLSEGFGERIKGKWGNWVWKQRRREPLKFFFKHWEKKRKENWNSSGLSTRQCSSMGCQVYREIILLHFQSANTEYNRSI